MRHLTGIFLAMVMAAVLYAEAGWGAGRIDALRAHGTSLATAPGAEALAVLAAAGVLLGVMMAVRPSRRSPRGCRGWPCWPGRPTWRSAPGWPSGSSR